AGAQLVGWDVQPCGDLVGVGLQIAVLIAQQQHRERRIVVHDDAAFAVQDLAARREDGDLLDAILFSQRAVITAARHLQAPQPEGKHQEDSQQNVLHCGKPELRDFFVATEHQELQLSQGLNGCKVSKLAEYSGLTPAPLYEVARGRTALDFMASDGSEPLNYCSPIRGGNGGEKGRNSLESADTMTSGKGPVPPSVPIARC